MELDLEYLAFSIHQYIREHEIVGPRNTGMFRSQARNLLAVGRRSEYLTGILRDAAVRTENFLQLLQQAFEGAGRPDWTVAKQAWIENFAQGGYQGYNLEEVEALANKALSLAGCKPPSDRSLTQQGEGYAPLKPIYDPQKIYPFICYG